jgi:hypothetical protein
MRVVTQDSLPEADGPEPSDLEHAGQEAPGDPFRLDAMRSWLVNGVQSVDPRRRFGSHGRARELLVADSSKSGSERWQALAAALHRHTVRGGLSELQPDERHVITLAYLQGLTNREIAAVLGVSVTTVQRRLLFALGRLEAYIGRTGVWLSAVILVAAAYALRPGATLVRWVTTAAGAPDRAQRVATTLTAGAVSAAMLGIVAFTSDSTPPGKPPRAGIPPVVAQTIAAAPPAAHVASRISLPSSNQPTLVVESAAATAVKPDTEAAAPTPAHHHKKGCGHKRKSESPPSGSDSTGVSDKHPDPADCRTKDV